MSWHVVKLQTTLQPSITNDICKGFIFSYVFILLELDVEAQVGTVEHKQKVKGQFEKYFKRVDMTTSIELIW